jgi:hypothetical protein
MCIRTMSAAGRARIAAAQRARPAKVKSKKVVAISAPKRTMSLTSRKISRSSSESTLGEVAKSEKEGLAFVSLSRCISEPKGHSSVLGAAGDRRSTHLLDHVGAEPSDCCATNSAARLAGFPADPGSTPSVATNSILGTTQRPGKQRSPAPAPKNCGRTSLVPQISQP